MRALAITASVLVIAGVALATTRQGVPVVPISHIDGPVVMASGVKRLTDSLKLAEPAFAQYCRTGGSPQYVRRACAILTAITRNFDTLYASRFTVRRDSVFSQDTIFAVDTVWLPEPGTPPATPPGSCPPSGCPGYSVEYYANSDSQWFPRPGTDTATLCAVIRGPHPDTTQRLVWPPVRFRVLGDSSSWGRRGGNPLALMCANAMQKTGITSADSVTAPKVTWLGVWVAWGQGSIWRPLISLTP